VSKPHEEKWRVCFWAADALTVVGCPVIKRGSHFGPVVEQHQYTLALRQISGVGPILFKRLVGAFATPEAVFRVGPDALLAVEGISEKTARAILSFSAFSESDAEMNRVEKAGARLVGLGDVEYPPLLAAIDDPPPILYVKGELSASAPAVAVVGSRKMTSYGRVVAERIAGGLSAQGVTVVSGFARGIDGVAHRAALAGVGGTVAVLGCGVDCVYPPEHRKLYDEIIAKGAIVSEFPIGTAPAPHHFPQRNRIISGLSLGVVVVEAPLASGSLITARHALDQGREVFAVPGPITSLTSVGPHTLIQNGAKLVTEVADILVEILPHLAVRKGVEAVPLPPISGEEAVIFNCLAWEPKHIDQIIHESAQTVSMVSGLLLTLELKGAIRALPGQLYARAA